MTKQEREELAFEVDSIVRSHNGQRVFNLTETARIIGRSRKLLPAILDDLGIGVIYSGGQKQVTATDIARYLLQQRHCAKTKRKRPAATGRQDQQTCY